MTDPLEPCSIPETEDPLTDELAFAATVVVAAAATVVGAFVGKELMRRENGKEKER